MKRKEQLTAHLGSRRRYDAEFKASVLRMLENGHRVSAVSRSLGVSESVLHRWRSATRGTGEPIGEAAEIARLRRQVKQLETERDILKKALSIFSRVT